MPQMNSSYLSFERNGPLSVKAMENKNNLVTLKVELRHKTEKCPKCSKRSSAIHSHYSRKIKDLPAFGNEVIFHFLCKKFFCKNDDCDQSIFTERFNDQFMSYSRMSVRLTKKLLKPGLLTGGNAGSKIRRLHNIDISASTNVANHLQNTNDCVGGTKGFGNR